MNTTLIITGTRKGIGRFLAERYLERGMRVAGCSRKNSDLDHPNYRHFPLDVGDEAAVVAMVKSLKKEWGRIDCLINNAGAAAMNHLLLTPKSTVDRLMKVNFQGAFLFLREVGKAMTRKKYGRIVNLSTVAVPLALEGEAVYAASKAAVETLTKVAARELGAAGITVNAIGPAPVKTDLIKNVPEEAMQRLLERQAIPRFAQFEDVARVMDFFLDPAGDFITGQIMYLGGVHG
ncbi:MAG: SDR family oxidoreductase [Desulfovibrio sp.]|nr:MAG: SDR family oxidoreductase [Desulfovibrio sp.]